MGLSEIAWHKQQSDDGTAVDSGKLKCCRARFPEIVGNSAALQQVLDQIEIVAPMDSGVLIQGETGTGKELVARAIHN